MSGETIDGAPMYRLVLTERARPGSLIVDVSCDRGMGFTWARPTTFEEPTFVVGDNITYYAVDHTPSYLWNSATWENSEALLPFVETLAGLAQELGVHLVADASVGAALEYAVRVLKVLAFAERRGSADGIG